ncbi:hypothetical protein BJ170DRAFT_40586 [Xylariales sp. AK1849]|nr:hypothetical protein BJ170DRAFT_40586 [Xylariales sp. AK1849]
MAAAIRDAAILPALTEPWRSRAQMAGNILPRGAILATSGLLPVYAENGAWRSYLSALLIFGISFALFTYHNWRQVTENIQHSIASITIPTLLWFPFPGIGLQFVGHRIPMFLMLSSVIAIEIGKLRSQTVQNHRELFRASPKMMPAGPGQPREMLPRRSRSTGYIPDPLAGVVAGYKVTTEIMLRTLELEQMKGPASTKSQSDHSSDISMTGGGRASPSPSWDSLTRAFFVPRSTTNSDREGYPTSCPDTPSHL